MYKIFLAHIISPVSDKETLFLKKGAVVIKDEVFVDLGEANKILLKYSKYLPQVVDRQDCVLLPSFFDMHFHWVQDDVRLMNKASLLEWLSRYTWPYEAKFKSLSYTKKKALKFSKELLSVGTLGGAAYASIHGHTVTEALEKFKGDFIVGNVLMTMNSPKYLSQTKQEAIDLVKIFSQKFKQRYAMTPRFAITTDPDVMEKGARIAGRHKAFIQTHLSETENEIDYVLSLYRARPGFEKVKNYTEIYHRSKMLTSKTMMGHGIYLSEAELKVLKKTKTWLCHCPTSNAPVEHLGLGSGLFNFKKVESAKISWALGSDIGGGPYLSMFDVMESFVGQNKKNKEATYTKALYRATMAGATFLNLHKTNGSIKKKKFANFILVKAPQSKSITTAEKMLKAIIHPLRNDRPRYDSLVLETYFKGQSVFTRIERGQ